MKKTIVPKLISEEEIERRLVKKLEASLMAEVDRINRERAAA